MIKDAAEEFVKKLGSKIWNHDRLKTVGASEIGQCWRKIYWIKKEGAANPDHEDSWGARLRGNMMEEHFWVPLMKAKYGDNLLYAGAEQRTFEDKYLSATPDGILTKLKKDVLKHLGIPDIGSKEIMVECKSIDPRVNLIEAKKENEFQTQVQMGLVRQGKKFKPNFALISYTDASFWNEIKEYVIPFSQKIFDFAHVRATRILTADNAMELSPEGWIAGGKECEFCAYTKPCGIIRRSVPEKEAIADKQFVAEITDMVRDITQIKERVAKDTIELKAAEEAVKDRLREKSIRRIPGLITWSAVKGRESYDNKLIKEAAVNAGVDIEEFATVGEPTDRLQIFPIPGEKTAPLPARVSGSVNRKTKNG